MLVRIWKRSTMIVIRKPTIRLVGPLDNNDCDDDPIGHKSWQQQSCRSGFPSQTSALVAKQLATLTSQILIYMKIIELRKNGKIGNNKTLTLLSTDKC